VTLHAATGGSISGTVTDSSGAVIPGAALKLLNMSLQTIYRAISDKQGFYSFRIFPGAITNSPFPPLASPPNE
jgi:hypothetical protein